MLLHFRPTISFPDQFGLYLCDFRTTKNIYLRGNVGTHFPQVAGQYDSYSGTQCQFLLQSPVLSMQPGIRKRLRKSTFSK